MIEVPINEKDGKYNCMIVIDVQKALSTYCAMLVYLVEIHRDIRRRLVAHYFAQDLVVPKEILRWS